MCGGFSTMYFITIFTLLTPKVLCILENKNIIRQGADSKHQ